MRVLAGSHLAANKLRAGCACANANASWHSTVLWMQRCHRMQCLMQTYSAAIKLTSTHSSGCGACCQQQQQRHPALACSDPCLCQRELVSVQHRRAILLCLPLRLLRITPVSDAVQQKAAHACCAEVVAAAVMAVDADHAADQQQ